MELLLIAFAAWFTAQVIKFSIRSFQGDPDPRLFYQSGGMPSAHAATVVALATAALTTQGYESPVFGVSAVLAAIVIYDSLGVRRSSGEQSVMVNALLRATGNNKLVREVLGHTPAEVLAGAGFGAMTALLLTFSAWSEHAAWLVTVPGDTERQVYLALFAGLVVVALILRMVLTRYRKVEIMRRLKMSLWWGAVVPAGIGLFFSLLQHQTAAGGAWRLWPIVVIVGFLVAQFFLWTRVYRQVRRVYPQELHELVASRKRQRSASKKARGKAKRRKKR